jgi:AAA15 family ATPase/GTPase
MFTKLRFQNFRSFNNIELDLTHKDGTAKHLAIIYGENGTGKSNLMSGFVLLQELLATMNIRDIYQEILNKNSMLADDDVKKRLPQNFLYQLRDMQAIIDDYRMVGNNNPIIAEYEFLINGNKGSYRIEFGKNEIIYERLEYLLNHRRGTYFECAPGKIKINSGIVQKKDLLTDIKASAKRYWGKHSILAIIMHELHDKSKSYAQDNMSENFEDVVAELNLTSCYIGIGNRRWDELNTLYEVFESPIQGELALEDEKQLDMAEYILSSFLSAINSDIKKATYQRTFGKDRIEYRLYLEKMVAGEERVIDFYRESTGNHQLVHILYFLLSACMGDVVVIDEADAGIHDVLFLKIVQEIASSVNGQIIMTTHNTMLMEADFAREATYILSEEAYGFKQIRCVSAYEKRLYQKNNIRNKYLNNEYSGLPRVNSIDFESLISKIYECR